MEDSQVKSILVVDDEETLRMLLHMFLSSSGYACEIAADSSEAMEMLRKRHFDMVISDIRMPGKDGLELMQEAKTIYPNTDFIIMTGHAAEYSYSTIIKAGATDFAIKPLQLEELKAKLERIDREKRTLKQLKEANETLAWEASIRGSIAELSEALISAASHESMSLLVLKHAKQLTGSPWGLIGYIDHEIGSLMHVAVSGDKGTTFWIRDSDVALKRSTGLWEWVMENQKPPTPNDTAGTSGNVENRCSIHRFLSVPALAAETLAGIISVANAYRSYTEQDLLLIKRLAVIYALALQRKQKEDEVRQMRDYLDNIVDNSPSGISIVDRHGRFLKWNKKAAELYGYSYAQLKGGLCFNLYPDKDQLDKMLAKLRTEGSIKQYEIEMEKCDGNVVPFKLSISLLKDSQNKTIGSVCVILE
jgi:PAS domain S-box-containing protein